LLTISVPCYSFVYYYNALYQVQHSSPTRRSSDLGSADPVQRIAGTAAVSGCGLLDALAAHGELVCREVDDVERIHHRPSRGDCLGGGRVVAGEPVHRHHLDPVPKGLVTGVEPVGEDLGRTAGDHVQ